MTIDDEDPYGGWRPVVQEANRRFQVLEAYGYTRPTTTRGKGFRRHGEFSQHDLPVGPTAADFPGVPPSIPEFVERARLAGLVAIDETTREKALAHGSKSWTGPHMHVQLFKRGATPLGMLQPPRPIRLQISEPP